jgi:hypothetical protein
MIKKTLILLLYLGWAGFGYGQEPIQTTRPTTAYVLIVGPYHPTDPSLAKFPSNTSEFGPDRGGYFALYRITEDVAIEDKFNVEDWEVAIPPTRFSPINPSVESLTYMRANRTYVFQVSWYKERLAIRYQLRYAPTIGVAPVYYGCATPKDDDGICSENDMANCWCDIVYTDVLVDDGCADPGAVGLFISGAGQATCTNRTNPQQYQSFDNVKVYAFRPPPGSGSDCGGSLPPTPTRTRTATSTRSPTPVG